jgi:cellulose synthase operon protein B
VFGALRPLVWAAALAVVSTAAFGQSDTKPSEGAAAALLTTAPAPPAPILRQLANNAERYRLAGEIASIEWAIYLTDAQASEPIRFRLSYVAAVSIMPEASTLKLTINDAAIASTPILPTPQERTIEFEVPASLMKPGFNAVRISADQRHRVDCSLAATYELWTQIDPAATGLLLPADDRGPASLADLPALSPDDRGALPIRAVLPSHATNEDVERVMRAAQEIVLAGRFAQPLIDFGPPTDGPGLNLVIGTRTQVAEALADGVGSGPEPKVFMQAAREGRRATLVITGSDSSQVDGALGELASDEALKGSPAGLRAIQAAAGYPIDGGQSVKLREMGIVSQEFGGRLFRAAFSINLPTDFYAADYGKAMLDLAGGYAPGLRGQAEIAVSVNGRETTTLRLPRDSGEVYQHNDVPLPLGSMKPGLNRIEIAAELPKPEDASCATSASAPEPPRFLLLDSSTLTLPRIARIARSPDLAATAMGALPLAGAHKAPALVVPVPDKPSLAAAATLVARLAAASGRVTDYRLASAPPAPGEGSALVVGVAADLDPKLLGSMGLSKDLLAAAWGELSASSRDLPEDSGRAPTRAPFRRVALRRDRPLSCEGAPIPTPPLVVRADRAPAKAISAEGANPESSLIVQWNERVGDSFLERALRGVDSALEWGSSRYRDALDLFSRGFGPSQASAVLTKRSSLAIAQANFDSSPDGIVTLVTAPNGAALLNASTCLVDPGVWRNLTGRLAALDVADGSIASVPVEHSSFIVTQPLSPGNARLIAAGWFSLNSDVYVGLAFVFVLVLSCATTSFVRNVGRRAE